ncbi:hypothetical protein [Streptomyces gobiensis]|uniref:hypothetical protein n=1 Tax=Streptomyces gobiensis TaxID=2875706 RepID=UPI001E341BA2|nr:hypothetical protein [Streptomyces gobiensis]UGY94387.1 hypothetical protein test1122_23390 [Streptomyces gobiensis]
MRGPLARHRAHDTEAPTTRYLMYGLLPSWFVPGVLRAVCQLLGRERADARRRGEEQDEG